jgi:hypothetical protein
VRFLARIEVLLAGRAQGVRPVGCGHGEDRSPSPGRGRRGPRSVPRRAGRLWPAEAAAGSGRWGGDRWRPAGGSGGGSGTCFLPPLPVAVCARRMRPGPSPRPTAQARPLLGMRWARRRHAVGTDGSGRAHAADRCDRPLVPTRPGPARRAGRHGVPTTKSKIFYGSSGRGLTGGVRGCAAGRRPVRHAVGTRRAVWCGAVCLRSA